ncbi:hypothetical protein QYE76_037846 [Lolium multiflorum]|uniref:Uncharacterized protein n=1 Tax=Lolium multiflorum TaxID=4521 RepID=A0AAD8WT30_LOLMU|nr:hypothetical protein QYE76_037846 [Lolium multiflorum]
MIYTMIKESESSKLGDAPWFTPAYIKKTQAFKLGHAQGIPFFIDNIISSMLAPESLVLRRIHLAAINLQRAFAPTGSYYATSTVRKQGERADALAGEADALAAQLEAQMEEEEEAEEEAGAEEEEEEDDDFEWSDDDGPHPDEPADQQRALFESFESEKNL